MGILWDLFELSATVFEAFVLVTFISDMLDKKFRFKNGRLTIVIGALSLATVITIMNSLMIYEGLFGIIYSMVYFIYAMIALKGPVIKKVFISILTNLILILVNAFVCSLISTVFNNEISEIYIEKNVERIITILIVQTVLILVYTLLVKLFSRNAISLTRKEWSLIIFVFLISFCVIAFIHTVQLNVEIFIDNSILLAISEVGVILINIVCINTTIALSKSNNETLKLRITNQQSEYRSEYAKNVKKQYDEIRRIRHDMKQTYVVIESLLKDNKLEEALKFIQKNTQVLAGQKFSINTGNDFVNAILNSKLGIAKERGIEVICSISGDVMGIEDIDLCNLLGNILDNAIEANEKVTEKQFIELNINSDEIKMVIKVINSTSDIISDELKTTKEQPELHGFGVKTIKTIAEKYNGFAEFYNDNNQFETQVLLYKN